MTRPQFVTAAATAILSFSRTTVNKVGCGSAVPPPSNDVISRRRRHYFLSKLDFCSLLMTEDTHVPPLATLKAAGLVTCGMHGTHIRIYEWRGLRVRQEM